MLDDHYVASCVGAPSKWRSILHRAGIVGKVVRDLSSRDMVTLAQDPPYDEDE
jgi:hypothetical protein